MLSKKINGKIFWVLGPLLIFMIFISASRSALLVSLVSFLIVVIYSLVVGKKWSLLLVGLSFFIIFAFFFRHHKNRYKEASRYEHLLVKLGDLIKPSKSEGSSRARIIFGDRLDLWKAGWVVFKKNPVFGVGLGNYLVKMPKYQKEIGSIQNDNSGNMYLHVAAESGVVGLVIFLVMLGALFRIFYRKFKFRPDYMRLGAFGSMAGILLIFMFGAHLLAFETNILIWFITSLMTGTDI